MVTVPLTPRCEEAFTLLAESARNNGVTNEMFPPAPPTACAVTLLPCRSTILGSMKMFPPRPSAPFTDVVISLLLTRRTSSMARISISPPFALADSVVVLIDEPLCNDSCLPALRKMFPAFAMPELGVFGSTTLLAVIEALLVSVT